MLTAVAFLAAFSTAASFDQAELLRSDERLRAQISVHAKIVSTADFVGLLQRETGAKFEVAALDADRKLTVLCTARPASEVMERVAETLFMSWTFDKRRDTWRLELLGEVRKEEQAARRQAREQDQRVIRMALESLSKWGDLSQEEWAEESTAIRSRLATAEKAQGPDAQQKLLDAQLGADILSYRAWTGFGAAWKKSLEEAVARLAAGETLLASSRPEDNLPLVPEALVPKSTFETDGHKGILFMLRYVPSQGFLEGIGLMTGFKFGGKTAPGRLRLRQKPGENDLEKRLGQWGKALDSEVLLQAINPATARISNERFLLSAYSVSDHLEHLASGANVAVVADAFRIAMSDAVPFKADSVDEYVEFLRRPWEGRMPNRPGYIRTHGGWLMYRSHEYWKKLDCETPERLLRPMEEAARPLGTREYAELAGKLDTAQGVWISQMGNPVLVRFRRDPLGSALSALRLWSRLTPAQRGAAESPMGLSLAGLPVPDRQAFVQTVAESLWQSFAPDGFLSALFGGTDPSLKLYYRESVGLGNLSPEQGFLNIGVPPSLSTCVNVEFIYTDESRNSLWNRYALETRDPVLPSPFNFSGPVVRSARGERGFRVRLVKSLRDSASTRAAREAETPRGTYVGVRSTPAIWK